MKSASPNQPQGLVPSRDASRELDAVVAEKVMGWRWRRPASLRAAGIGFAALVPADWPTDARVIVAGDDAVLAACEHDLSILPHYSTDIVAAWLVVERMHADGWWIDIERDASGYLVVMEPFDPEDLRRVERRAETAPLAICLAARATLETPDA